MFECLNTGKIMLACIPSIRDACKHDPPMFQHAI
jgi:hypothetical protein